MAVLTSFFLHIQSEEWQILCDFDGTITFCDVTDAVLGRFALPAWQRYETEWVEGRISARECMAEQLALLHAPVEALDAFLDCFSMDPSFSAFAAWAGRHRLPLCIVSDGLDYAIRRILARNGVKGVPIAANRLVDLGAGKYHLEFPFARKDCGSGVCKCHVALSGGRKTLLIGDGQSDFCLASRADFVLAKQGKALEGYCRERGLPYAVFDDFRHICAWCT